MVKIGVIGGSGLNDPGIIKDAVDVSVRTDYGAPSSPLTCGRIGGVDVVILARHGRAHQFSPREVNNRANLKALENLGVTHILATTACGSLRAEIGRGHFVVLDQFIDFTRFRENSFFGSFAEGVNHCPMAHPFSKDLRKRFLLAGEKLALPIHSSGCVITIEGPRFSTFAESKMFRLLGADLVNMSTAPEAILANELKIPYAAMAMATDYDCWKEDEPPVSWQEVIDVFERNTEKMKQLLIEVIKQYSPKSEG